MNVGSLFTGIGGIDLGLERAGMHVAWQCEADPFRRSVLAHRFPGVECATDVQEFQLADGWRLPAGLPRGTNGRSPQRAGASGPDLVCGGFPCQDLSVAGRRAGLAGERSGLFFEFARIADTLLPPGGWILLENVPGLLSSQGGRDYAVVLATLAELGFHDLAWRVLDSRHFGVAQRRRRVYILARRARGQRACQVLLEPEGSAGHPQTRPEAGQDVAVASLSGLGSGGPDDNDGQAGRIVTARTLTANDRYDGDTETFIASPLEASDGHHGYSSPRGDGADNLVADTLTSGSHPASNMPGRRREDDTNIVAAYHFRTRENGSCFEETEVNVTKASVGGSGGAKLAMQTAQGVRRLTPRECERLQGFPDDWTLIPGASDSKRYAALGDAVTVPVAEWIGRRLIEVAA